MFKYRLIFIVLLLTTAVQWSFGQELQWLQYHSARETREVVGSVGSQSLRMSADKPQGVELPEFNQDAPLFTKWSSPMVEKGYLWLALDGSQKNGAHDLLYIDSNGDGNLSDEEATRAYRSEGEHAYFGPVKVVFQTEDGPVIYHLNFRLCDHGRAILYASSGGWYEGPITVGGEQKHCVLIDYNANGVFNDKSEDFSQSDRIRIGKKDERGSVFVGNYIEIDGKLYRPEIGRDGANIALAVAEDVIFGNIQLPESIKEFAAGGENGQFSIKLEKGSGKLPVGKYRIHHWSTERKGDKGNTWKLVGNRFTGNKGLFDVTQTGQVNLTVGEPIISKLEVKKKNNAYSFNQNMTGRLGENIEITRNGTRPQAPKLHIKSDDGSYKQTFSFEYG